MTRRELDDILKAHKRWLNGDSSGVEANFRYTNLSGTDLSGANLSGANFSGANFRYTNLSGANLSGANFRYTDFSGADFGEANFNNVSFNSTTCLFPLQCPEIGSFIGYKKASNKIIKLEICEDSLRSSATSRKCRCSKAKVLSIENLDGTASELTEISSDYDSTFVYKIGEIIEVKDFDMNRWNECSSWNECSTGIHFFITREEAVGWRYWK